MLYAVPFMEDNYMVCGVFKCGTKGHISRQYHCGFAICFCLHQNRTVIGIARHKCNHINILVHNKFHGFNCHGNINITSCNLNIKTLVNTIGKSKIAKITLAPTMGPGVRIDLGSI